MRYPIRCCLLAVCVLAAGCTSPRNWLSSINNNADPAVGPDEQWVRDAGMEARGDRPKEMATEHRWFREFTMSERAREIERNFGIYD